MNVHHHSLIGPVGAAVQLHRRMMEKGLAGIKPGQGIKLNGAEHGAGFPHFDQIPDAALDAPGVVGLPDKVHSPKLQAPCLVVRIVASRGHDHRYGCQKRVLPGSGQKLEAVTPGHIYIQNHQRKLAVML